VNRAFDPANQPPILAVSHTYDRMSNLLTADDARPGAQLPFRNRAFTYDELNRLISEERSPTISGSYTEQHLAEAWDLDMLGNWDMKLRDIEKDGDASDATGIGSTQNRLHNKANEIEDPTGTGSYDMVRQNSVGSTISRYFRFGYDDAGNMTEDRVASALPVPGQKMPGLVMTYDAWNRLVDASHQVGSGTLTAISAYTYNALGWRTSKQFDTSAAGYDGIDQARVMLFDASWRMIEERIDIDTAVNSDSEGEAYDDEDWVSQQFWGLRYIDDALAKRINRDTSDPDGWVSNDDVTFWYQITDAQFSVCAILNADGLLYERIDYDAYGNARHRPAGDAYGDGVASFADVGAMGGANRYIGNSLYHADFDLDFDGDSTYTTEIVSPTSPTDLSIATSGMWFKTALPEGWVSDVRSTSTGPDNSIGYAGYVFNPERDDYTVRLRVYEPSLGRWRQSDPIGYRGGKNLNDYVGDNPLKWADPFGLEPEFVGPIHPGDDLSDPRNDPDGDCGITVRKYSTGRKHAPDTGHQWIEISDPANDKWERRPSDPNGEPIRVERVEGWGFWPADGDGGGDYGGEPGHLTGPGEPQPAVQWESPPLPDGSDPYTGGRLNPTLWNPFKPYIETNVVGRRFRNKMSCREIRDCVRSEMKKYRGKRWNLWTNSCRGAVRQALRKCKMGIATPGSPYPRQAP